MSKPRFISPCTAERYTRARQMRIAEFSNAGSGINGLQGGLITLNNYSDGQFFVHLYNLDPHVRVRVPLENLVLHDDEIEKLIEMRKDDTNG